MTACRYKKGDLILVKSNAYDRDEDSTGIIFSCLTTDTVLPGQNHMYNVLIENRFEIIFENEVTKIFDSALFSS